LGCVRCNYLGFRLGLDCIESFSKTLSFLFSSCSFFELYKPFVYVFVVMVILQITVITFSQDDVLHAFDYRSCDSYFHSITLLQWDVTFLVLELG